MKTILAIALFLTSCASQPPLPPAKPRPSGWHAPRGADYYDLPSFEPPGR